MERTFDVALHGSSMRAGACSSYDADDPMIRRLPLLLFVSGPALAAPLDGTWRVEGRELVVHDAGDHLEITRDGLFGPVTRVLPLDGEDHAGPLGLARVRGERLDDGGVPVVVRGPLGGGLELSAVPVEGGVHVHAELRTVTGAVHVRDRVLAPVEPAR